jgi:hypothetical protein
VVLSRIAVYKLDDLELAQALHHMSKDALSILRSDWERNFAQGIQEAYVKFGGLTWKQRKVAREVLCRLVEEVQRRATVQS